MLHGDSFDDLYAFYFMDDVMMILFMMYALIIDGMLIYDVMILIYM